MAGRRLDQFRRLLSDSSVTESARRLLGCEIECAGCKVRIIETEAYGGDDDPGSHAYRGATPRNAPMFGAAGRAYVYFTYGNHWMLNVTCRPVGEPGAVLVRGAVPLDGLHVMRRRRPKARSDYDLLSGPGKIAQTLAVNGSNSGCDLLGEGPIALVPRPPVKELIIGLRIGLAVGKGEEKAWRFIDQEFVAWASRPHLSASPISVAEVREQ